MRLKSLPLGFRAEHILSATIYAPTDRHASLASWSQSRDELFRTLEAVPGVIAVAAATDLPLENPGSSPIAVEGKPPVSPGLEPLAADVPSYFNTMEIPLLQGRAFTDGDRSTTANVAVLNQAAAQLLFPNDNPLNHRVKQANPDRSNPWFTVVGVVGDTRSHTYNSMEWKVRPQVFFPFEQADAADLDAQGRDYGQLVIRTSGDPNLLSQHLREAIGRVEPGSSIRLRPITERVSTMLLEPKLRAVIIGVFAILALLSITLGLYGVISQSVVQQRREIGIRMAFGAQSADVLKMVLGSGLRIVLIGLGIGAAVSIAISRLLQSFLYAVSPLDPVVLTSACLALLGIGLSAAYLPARLASRLDPVNVLRDE